MSRNLPNQITIARLITSVVLFVLLAQYDASADSPRRWLLHISFWVFIVAALSDLVDGYVARKYKLETALGRILDPLVDKILLCGAFVFFAGARFVVDGQNVTGVAAWMVVLIFGRELLVTGLRGVSESKGTPFGANVMGKLKMVCQSIAVGWILATLAEPNLFSHRYWAVGRVVFVYLAVALTAASIFVYLHRARGVLRDPSGA